MAFRIRRGTNAQRLTITPEQGELLYTTDTKILYIGDGVTVGGTPAAGSTGTAWGTITGTVTNQTDLTTYLSSNYQPLDGDLTAIAALTGTSGFLKKTAANTWSLDTNDYVTSVTLSGDVTGSGTSTINATLASVITAGGPTGSSSVVPVITYDAKGRLTAVSTATITPSAIGAQTALNGTGFVRMSGTTVSYVTGTSSQFVKADGSLDSSAYYLASNPSGYTSNTGTVTTLSVVSANGFAGTVATATTTPAITLTTTVTGLLKGNGTAISAAVAGTDYSTSSSTETLSNKSISFGSNTLTTTLAQLNTAISDADVATLAGTETLTNKRITDRVFNTTSTATLTPDMSLYDVYEITAQAATLAFANPIGTPVAGNKMIIRIKDNGTTRTLSFTGTQYRASSDLSFPTATTVGKTLYLGFIYNVADTKWDLIAKLDNF